MARGGDIYATGSTRIAADGVKETWNGQRWVRPASTEAGGTSKPETSGGSNKPSHPSPWDPYDVNGRAFTLPKGTGAFTSNLHGIAGDARTSIERAEEFLSNPIVAPTPSAGTPIRPQTVRPTTSGVQSGINTAVELLNNTTDSRDRQVDATGIVRQTATGQGPSVAPDMIRENSAKAAAEIERLTTGANRQFGTAANDARLGYSDALATQQTESNQAAALTARAIRDAAESTIRQQAALTSSARGGNIGAAVLNAQDNAAFQMAGANRQATDVLAERRAAAAAQAAAAQRQAAAGQQAADLLTGENLARGQISAVEQRALGDARAGQVMSQEMLAAQGLLVDATGQIRGADISATNAATGIANTDLAKDTLITETDTANADRNFQGQVTTDSNELTREKMRGDWALQAAGLNADAAKAIMDAGISRESFSLATKGDFIKLAAQMGMSAEQLRAQAYAQAQSLGVAWETASDAQRTAILGAIITGVATIGGAAIGGLVGGPAGAVAGGAVGAAAAS